MADLEHDVVLPVSVTPTGILTGLPGDSAARETQLLSYLTFDPVSKLTGDDSGSVVWNFAATESHFDYLADGEIATLTYVATLNDGTVNTTNTQTITINITGTNDKPVITQISPTGALTEVSGTKPGASELVSGDAQGTITIRDLDDTDKVTLEETFVDIVWSAGTLAETGLSATQQTTLQNGFVLSDTAALEIDDATSSVSSGWTYTTGEDLNFLDDGETLTLRFSVVARDHSGVIASEASDPQIVTITITGTNDAPTVSATATAGFTEAGDASAQALSDSGTVSFGDIDTNDVYSHS